MAQRICVGSIGALSQGRGKQLGQQELIIMRYWEILPEKWSPKYKKSINCARPKGFSQKAHCAGRKKK